MHKIIAFAPKFYRISIMATVLPFLQSRSWERINPQGCRGEDAGTQQGTVPSQPRRPPQGPPSPPPVLLGAQRRSLREATGLLHPRTPRAGRGTGGPRRTTGRLRTRSASGPGLGRPRGCFRTRPWPAPPAQGPRGLYRPVRHSPSKLGSSLTLAALLPGLRPPARGPGPWHAAPHGGAGEQRAPPPPRNPSARSQLGRKTEIL